MGLVLLHRPFQNFIGLDLLPPPEIPEPRIIRGVPQVVKWRSLVLGYIGRWDPKHLQELVAEADVGHHVRRANAEDLADRPFVQDRTDRIGRVGRVDVTSAVLPIAVEEQPPSRMSRLQS